MHKEGTYKAILLSSTDYKENDKLLRLLTVEGGIITAVMRGVKKPTAKLRFGAVPFAFCEYTLCGSGMLPLVIGCSQIEDLFSIANDYDNYTAGCIMLEVSDYAIGNEPNPALFVSLLKSLKLVLYNSINPYLVVTRFIQKIIHTSGYAYQYPLPPVIISTEIELLSLLDYKNMDMSIDDENDIFYKISDNLILKTLNKIIANFEKKFEEKIKAKRLLLG